MSTKVPKCNSADGTVCPVTKATVPQPQNKVPEQPRSEKYILSNTQPVSTPPPANPPGIARFAPEITKPAAPPPTKPADSKQMEKLARAVEVATQKYYDYMVKRVGGFKTRVLFGPNLDTCYRWRLAHGWIDDVSGSSKDQINIEKAFALKTGIPDLDKLPKEFNMLTYFVNYSAREDMALSRNQLLVPKHFPGGNWIELTEHNEHTNKASLNEAKNTFLKPFVFMFKNKPPRAIMISHVKHTMENEIWKKEPWLEKYHVSTTRLYPASLSPAIIRGLLRHDLDFEGMVIGDWTEMLAISKFIEKCNLGPEYSNLSKKSKIFVMAVLAGVNWPLHLLPDTGEIWKLYSKNNIFKKIFDEHIMESFYINVKYSDRPKILELDKLDFKDIKKDDSLLSIEKREIKNKLIRFLKNLDMDNKIAILTHSPLGNRNEIVTQLNRYYYNYADLWNRGGILALKFMKDVVSEITQKDYPDPSGKTDETEWVTNLMRDPEFVRIYRTIDWGSPFMVGIYKKTLQKFTAKGEKKRQIIATIKAK